MRPIFIIIFGYVLRLLNAAYVSYNGAETSLELDAQGMYQMMRDVSRSGVPIEYSYGVDFHVNSLAKIFAITGDDVFWACAIPATYWFIGAIFFLKSLEVMKASPRDRTIIIFIYALLPGTLFFTSIPLREALQLAGINVAVWGAILTIVRRNPLGWLFIMAGVCVAGLLHGALVAIGAFLVVGVFVMDPAIKSGRLVGPRLLIAAIAVMVALPFVITLTGYSVDNGALDAAAQYQAGGISEEARSNYKELDAGGGVVAGVLLLPIGLFQYLAEPLPWRIGGVSDIYLFFENMFRLLCIYVAFRIWQRTRGREAMLQGNLLVFYIAHEALWSLGTVNWGTAMRHHVPILGVQLLMVARINLLWPTRENVKAGRVKAAI